MKRVHATHGWRNKLRVIFYGPGWETGKPRLGLLEDIPPIEGDVEMYDPPNSLDCQLYYSFHFLLILLLHVNCASYALNQSSSVDYSLLKSLFNFSFILLSFISFAGLMENSFHSSLVECARCLLFILCQEYILLFSPSNAASSQLTSLSQLADWSVAINALFKLIYFSSMMYHLFNFIHAIQRKYSIQQYYQKMKDTSRKVHKRQPSIHITSKMQ